MPLSELLRRARSCGASDLHVLAGMPGMVRVAGEIRSLGGDALGADEVRELALGLLDDGQRRALERERMLCVSVEDDQAGRVRVSLYHHRGVVEMSVRLSLAAIGDRAELGLPEAVDELARASHGLVLIAGRAGVGKTTTLNYMVDLINRERAAKIVTIEDPVEYQHRSHRSLVVQLEVRGDVPSFADALSHVVRQDPDVIVVGEMCDAVTVRTALAAADTGHLVLATLHTTSADQTIERITGMLGDDVQGQVVQQLAASLQGVVVQELVPRADGRGRVLASEVLIATPAVRANIRGGTTHKLRNVVATGRAAGMMTMDASLLELYERAVITYDAAASRAREPDALRGMRGMRRAGPA